MALKKYVQQKVKYPMPNPDRSTYVSPSEVGALFGVHPWKTKFQMWHEKQENIKRPNLDKRADINFGKMMEGIIGDYICEKNGWKKLPKKEYFHRIAEGMGGECDGLVFSSINGLGDLEIKTANWGKFKEEWINGQAPLYYQLQKQFYMGLGGFKWGGFAVYVLGQYEPQPPVIYEFDPDIFKMIEKEIKAFWQSVKDGIEPEMTEQDYGIPFFKPYVSDEILDLSDDEFLSGLITEYAHRDKEFKKSELNKCHAKQKIQKYLFDKNISAKKINVNGTTLLTKITKETDARKGFQSLTINYEGTEANE